VTGIIFNSVMQVDRDGVPWIDDGELGWIPVTSRAGRPLTVAQQARGTVAYHPLGGGWHLPYTGRYPHEDLIVCAGLVKVAVWTCCGRMPVVRLPWSSVIRQVRPPRWTVAGTAQPRGC